MNFFKGVIKRILQRLRDLVWRLTKPGGGSPISYYLDRQAVIRARSVFLIKTYDAINVRWVGHQCYQYPMDAWLIQEVLSDTRPDLIVETGTYMGGSSYFYACICDLLGHGEVISIDIQALSTIEHPRITYLQGSSTDPAMVQKVKSRIAEIGAKKILVILDSDHRAEHVQKELELYSPLVPLGGYIHVQDGNADELPILKKFRPGPMAAAMKFLHSHPEFMRDIDLEKRYLMTEHPYGWLKRAALSPVSLQFDVTVESGVEKVVLN